jgi:hypothetical protein
MQRTPVMVTHTHLRSSVKYVQDGKAGVLIDNLVYDSIFNAFRWITEHIDEMIENEGNVF